MEENSIYNSIKKYKTFKNKLKVENIFSEHCTGLLKEEQRSK